LKPGGRDALIAAPPDLRQPSTDKGGVLFSTQPLSSSSTFPSFAVFAVACNVIFPANWHYPLQDVTGAPRREDVLGHPVAGGNWEGFVMESLLAVAPEGTDATYPLFNGYRSNNAGNAAEATLRPDRRT
jgi:hypothetical protein